MLVTKFFNKYLFKNFTPMVLDMAHIYDGVHKTFVKTTYFVNEEWRNIEMFKTTSSEEIANICYVNDVWNKYKMISIFPSMIMDFGDTGPAYDSIVKYIHRYNELFKDIKRWLDDGNVFCDMDNENNNKNSIISIQDKWRNDLRK